MYEEWLQCNSMKKYERYKEEKVETKRKVEEERLASLGWGQEFDRSYEENKKKFWKKVKSKKGWLEDGRNSEKCKWTDVERE